MGTENRRQKEKPWKKHLRFLFLLGSGLWGTHKAVLQDLIEAFPCCPQKSASVVWQRSLHLHFSSGFVPRVVNITKQPFLKLLSLTGGGIKATPPPCMECSKVLPALSSWKTSGWIQTHFVFTTRLRCCFSSLAHCW